MIRIRSSSKGNVIFNKTSRNGIKAMHTTADTEAEEKNKKTNSQQCGQDKQLYTQHFNNHPVII